MLSRIKGNPMSSIPQSINMAVHQPECGCVRLIILLLATKVSDFRYYRESARARNNSIKDRGKNASVGFHNDGEERIAP